MPLLQIHNTSPQVRVVAVAIVSPGQLGTGPLRSTRYEPGLHPPAPNLVEPHPSGTPAEELVQGPSRTVAELVIFLHEGYSD